MIPFDFWLKELALDLKWLWLYTNAGDINKTINYLLAIAAMILSLYIIDRYLKRPKRLKPNIYVLKRWDQIDPSYDSGFFMVGKTSNDGKYAIWNAQGWFHPLTQEVQINENFAPNQTVTRINTEVHECSPSFAQKVEKALHKIGRSLY